MLNFSLSPELIAIQAEARKFALKELLPVAWEYDQREETPMHLLHKAYDAGLINGDIPEAYGGKGYGILEGVIVTEELAAVCPGLATSIFDNSLGMEPLILCNNEIAKEKISGDYHPGPKILCLCHLGTHHGIGRLQSALPGPAGWR